MGVLIDTSIWIDVERGRLSPADVAHYTRDEPIFLSPVTIAELGFGAERVRDKPDLHARRAAALDRLRKKPTLCIDGSTGEIFGRLAAFLCGTGRGHAFRVQDLWIASQAIQYGFKLLTHNKKDFEDIPGLDILVLPQTTAQ